MSSQAAGTQGWLALYGGTVFLTSAVVLVLEITAGRLIAPYVGVSLYTWTSVIGVILAGLALGNWLGGVWVDRGGGDTSAGITLAAASVATFAVLLVLTFVAPLIQGAELNLLGASFLFVLSLFFLPAALLGVITPLLTTLALRLDPRSGRVVGTMHALAALGSIIGTFVTGFWLIQYFGTRSVLMVSGAVLFLLALPFLIRGRRRSVLAAVALIAAVVGAVTHMRGGFGDPCHRESQYYCIRVEDASADVPFGRASALVLDHLLHGINHETEPGMLVAPYVHLMDELVLGHLGRRAEHARYYFAGGGAYSHPRAVRTLAPRAAVTVAEIDPLVTRTASEKLFVSTHGMRILHMDARVALERLADERFDVIVGDVFQDIAAPYHLTTSEYAALVKSRLAENGLYLLNVADAYPDPRLVKSLLKTLRLHFAHVHVWLDEIPSGPQRATFVLSATDRFEPPATLTSQRGFEQQWLRVTKHLLDNATPLSQVPVLSDDYVPVERLLTALLVTTLGQ